MVRGHFYHQHNYDNFYAWVNSFIIVTEMSRGRNIMGESLKESEKQKTSNLCPEYKNHDFFKNCFLLSTNLLFTKISNKPNYKNQEIHLIRTVYSNSSEQKSECHRMKYYLAPFLDAWKESLEGTLSQWALSLERGNIVWSSFTLSIAWRNAVCSKVSEASKSPPTQLQRNWDRQRKVLYSVKWTRIKNTNNKFLFIIILSTACGLLPILLSSR